MNDILFGNNNSKVITKLSKRYFKKNKVRNLAALLAITDAVGSCTSHYLDGLHFKGQATYYSGIGR